MKSMLRWGFVVVAVGCASVARKPFPEIQTDQFRLTIEADWHRAGTGSPVQIVHRLSNGGPVAVCVGGVQEILVDQRVTRSTHLHDALCQTPLVEVPPGGSGEWSVPWDGLDCLEEPPPGIVERWPGLRCGARVQVRSRIMVYRLRGRVPQRGATTVMSNAADVVAASGY